MPAAPFAGLTAAHFASATDPEAARYRILAALAEARRAFAANRVFPHLAALVGVRRTLADLAGGLARHRERPRGPATGVDWDAGRLVYADDAPPLLAEDLARWSQPLLEAAIDEGRALYDFADAHAPLAPLGLVPAYQREGFLIVSTDDAVRALRYHASILTGPDGRHLSLRTHDVPVDLSPLGAPADWKSALAAHAADLATPAAFHLHADLDLPLGETLVPLAKRKLLAAVHGEA